MQPWALSRREPCGRAGRTSETRSTSRRPGGKRGAPVRADAGGILRDRMHRTVPRLRSYDWGDERGVAIRLACRCECHVGWASQRTCAGLSVRTWNIGVDCMMCRKPLICSSVAVLLGAIVLVPARFVSAAVEGERAATPALTNKMCPVLRNEPVVPHLFSDFEGQRVYF